MARRRDREPWIDGVVVTLLKVWGISAIVSAANLLVGRDQLIFDAILQGLAPFARWGLIISTPLLPLAIWWALRGLRAARAAGKSLRELQALSPSAFERWVGARFGDLGHSVQYTGAQGDHGVDLVVSRDGERAVVQCKNYKVRAVGEPTLRDLYGAMQDFEADRAYLVTTGQVTKAAAIWSKGKPITTWDGRYLAQLSVDLTAGPGKTAMEERFPSRHVSR